MVWYSHLFNNFSVCYDPHTQRMKQWNRVKCFPPPIPLPLKSPCFLYDPADVGNFISGSFAFTKPSLDIWNFSVNVMLKPSMQDIKYNFTSMGDECNCLMVWTFFSTVVLGNWDEDWPLLMLWSLLNFPDFLIYWMKHFYSIIF